MESTSTNEMPIKCQCKKRNFYKSSMTFSYCPFKFRINLQNAKVLSTLNPIRTFIIALEERGVLLYCLGVARSYYYTISLPVLLDITNKLNIAQSGHAVGSGAHRKRTLACVPKIGNSGNEIDDYFFCKNMNYCIQYFT